jgi:glycosyltransferase involved in cell wall biosynthesis
VGRDRAIEGEGEVKLVMFVDKPLPNERPTGIGVAAFNMALALSRRGDEVRFVCRGETERETSLNDRLTVQTIRNYSRDNLRAALDIMRRERPEIVHVHSTAALPSLLLGRALGRGVVVHSHGDEPLHPLRLALMRKIGMNFSHRVVAVSKTTREGLIRSQRLSPAKVVVAYNGVDTEEFRPSTGLHQVLMKYHLEDFDKIILSIGALQQRKGQEKIIQCLPEILEKWPHLVYVNVGRPYDKSYQARLMEGAERLGVSKNVKLLVTVPHEDLVPLINSAYLCVHASTREPFGLATVEEMACGKAVVAFDSGAMPEIIDDRVDGLLVPPDDQGALTRSILELLGDSQLAKTLGGAARTKVVTKFTWDQTASRLKTIYAGILS